jgi:hypothetical protein
VHVEQGTLVQFSCPGAHAQNGVAKRKHRHILETARALMIASSIPPHFWADAIFTVTYLINTQPSSTLQGGIPFELLCDKMPDYSNLHLFGYVCYVLLTPRKRTKLTTQSIKCVFLGYSAEYKCYRCWDPVARMMQTSRDVAFDESCPFYSRPTIDASLASLVDHLSFLLFPDAPLAYLPIPRSTLLSSVSSFESFSVVPDYMVKPPVTQFYSHHGARLSDAPASSDVVPFLLSLRMCHLLLLLIALQSSLFDVVTTFVGHLTITLLRLSQPLLFLSQLLTAMVCFIQNGSTRWLRRLMLLSRLAQGI